MSSGSHSEQPSTTHGDIADNGTSVFPLPSQVIQARQQAQGQGVVNWNPEPETRWTRLPLPQERERGWTHHDVFIDYGEDGRTYQGYMPGEYNLPNDGEEQDRQDFQHAVYEIALNSKLALAPIDSPKNALDIGTGTGIWAIDFAEQNPDCQVIGTDLSMIQAAPRTSNCVFFLENSETAEWMIPHMLDYVHLRNTGPCFSDIRTVFTRAYNNMSPGGWIELQDGVWELYSVDNSHIGSAFEKWISLLILGAMNQGRDMTKVRKCKQYLSDTGYINIHEEEIPMPTSPWTRDQKLKKLGYYVGTTMLCALEPYRRTLGAAGLGPAEIDELNNAVRAELQDIRKHWFMLCYVIYAQKPFSQQS